MSWILRVKPPSRALYTFIFAQVFSVAVFGQSLFTSRSEWGPLNYGLGGASATVLGDLESHVNNPAALNSFRGRSAFGGSYQWLQGDRSTWSVGLVDGMGHMVGGFFFQWADQDPSEFRSYNATLAYPNEYVWVGGDFQALHYSDVPYGKGWHLGGGFGILAPLPGGLNIGIYTRNLIDNNRDHEVPPRVQAGVAYDQPEKFRLTVESGRKFNIENQDWNFSTGLQVYLAQYAHIMGGYHWNRSDEPNFWAAGGGLASEKMRIRVVWHQTIEDGDGALSFDTVFSF